LRAGDDVCLRFEYRNLISPNSQKIAYARHFTEKKRKKTYFKSQCAI